MHGSFRDRQNILRNVIQLLYYSRLLNWKKNWFSRLSHCTIEENCKKFRDFYINLWIRIYTIFIFLLRKRGNLWTVRFRRWKFTNIAVERWRVSRNEHVALINRDRKMKKRRRRRSREKREKKSRKVVCTIKFTASPFFPTFALNVSMIHPIENFTGRVKKHLLLIQ